MEPSNSIPMQVNTWQKEDETSRRPISRREESQSGKISEESLLNTRDTMPTGYHLTNNASEPHKNRCQLLCPPGTKVARYMLIAMVCAFSLGTLYSVTPIDAVPGGHLFSLVVLVAICWVFGEIVTKLRMPALLGMLLVGIAFKNIPNLNLASALRRDWSAALRTLALVIIMTRAGLGLDPEKLKTMKWVCLRTAILPCVADGLAAGASAYWLLGYPIMGSFTFGFVMAGLSPAVVVPLLLGFQERGLGVGKGIPTLGIFAVGVDNAVAVCLFGIFLSMTFTHRALWFLIISGPLQILAGILYGASMGFVSWYVPNHRSKWVILPRFALLFSGSLFAVFYSRQLNFGGAGVIGALVFSFVAAYRWRQDSSDGDKAVAKIYSVMWLIMQPVLFGLIGSEIDLSSINPEAVGYGVAAMFIGIGARMVVVALSVTRSGFNWRETLFIQLSNFPKATVQAAIGGLVLEAAREFNAGAEAERMGSETLTMAALSILITSPLGGVLMSLMADKLLVKAPLSPNVHAQMDDEETGHTSS